MNEINTQVKDSSDNYRLVETFVGPATERYSSAADSAGSAYWQTVYWHRRSEGACYTCHISDPEHNKRACLSRHLVL